MSIDQSAVSVTVECPACKVYDKWLKDKEAEIGRLNQLLQAAQEDKKTLETRILTLLRVIPSNGNKNPVTATEPIRTSSTHSWEAKKKELEKLGREKAAGLTQEEKAKWEKKAADAAKKEGFEAPKISEIDFTDQGD